MRKDKTYIFFQDAAHGWLQVERQEVEELGLSDKITEYSYQNGRDLYLEEDCDMTSFIRAYEQKFNYAPMMIDSKTPWQKDSAIRGFDSYQPSIKKDLTNIKIVIK